jgi:dipeptidyl aminopeptidase/acylaminoacyl peptidase
MDASLADLALIDVETGSVNRIARGQRPRGYWISPDGTQVAYTAYQGNESDGSQQALYDLHVHTLEERSTRLVRSGLRLDYGITVSWSPDSTKLAILTGGPKAQGDCLIVSALGSEPSQQTPSAHPSFAAHDPTGNSRGAPPLWDDNGTALYCVAAGDLWKIKAADAMVTWITHGDGPSIQEAVAVGHGRLWCFEGGKSAIVVTRDDGTKRVGYERVDLQTGRRVQLIEEDRSYGSAVFSTRVCRSGPEIIYRAEDAGQSADLWLVRPDFRNARRITRVNPQLGNSTFGQSRLVQWHGVDGETLRGALLLPGGYRKDQRYPMVVRVYGGSDLSDGLNRFGLSGTGVENLQLLATRGFAVLAVDAHVRPGIVSRDLLKAVMPGVDEVIKMGVADPDRIGVMGHSFGGYSTLALITQTTRFRAAVASAGPADWASSYGGMDHDGSAFGVSYCEEGQPGLGGPPWMFPQRYVENSPVYHLDRVRTPLLLVHGALDTTVTPSQSEEVFVGLRRLGREVTYVRYEGEGHSPRYWSHTNAADYLNRVVDWFDTHLAPSVNR